MNTYDTCAASDLLLSMATNQWQNRDVREEVRDLVDQLNTGGPREFSFSKDVVLKTALLIADVDVRFRDFHEDHIFPKSRFTPKRLADAGIPHDQIEGYREIADCLPNLQLLAGLPNIEKQAKLPGDWVSVAFPSDVLRATYFQENDLDDLPLDLADFLGFYAQRKERMRERLLKVLGVA